MKKYWVQKNEDFGVAQDAWIDVLEHDSLHLAQAHMHCIRVEHEQYTNDIVMQGAPDTQHKGVLLMVSSDGSQMAYRIDLREDFVA